MAGSEIGLGKDGARLRKRPKKKDFVDAMVTHIETARILEADEIKGQEGAVAPSSPKPNLQWAKSKSTKMNLRQGQDEEKEEKEEEEEEEHEPGASRRHTGDPCGSPVCWRL